MTIKCVLNFSSIARDSKDFIPHRKEKKRKIYVTVLDFAFKTWTPTFELPCFTVFLILLESFLLDKNYFFVLHACVAFER